MIVLAFIGSLAVLFGAFYLGFRMGADYMVEIVMLAAKRSGIDPLRFVDELDIAKRDYHRGERA